MLADLDVGSVSGLLEAYWAYCVLAVVLVVASVTDIRTGKIYNVVTYPAVAIGLIGHSLVSGPGFADQAPMGLAGAAVGLVVGLLPLLAAWMAGGIGGGDAKLMGAVGALAGWRFALAALAYGLAIAAVMAVVVILKRRIARKTLVRILRFAYLTLTPVGPADPATAESPKIAFGLALCIGAAAVLVDVVLSGPLANRFLLGI